jgi:predicted nucleic acid-binding protein
MEPILVDTSVWIDWLNGKITPETDLVFTYLEQNGQIFITPTILQETLQGIKDDNYYHKVKVTLLTLTMLSINSTEAAIGSADLYRTLRKKGITIRKANDCLIAYFALFYDISLLHNDSDFNQIAILYNLRTIKL